MVNVKPRFPTLAIRTDAASGISRQALARQYGVSPSAIAHVLNRATWRHI